VKQTILINYDEQEHGRNKWKAVATVDGESYYAEGATKDEAYNALKEKIDAGNPKSD